MPVTPPLERVKVDPDKKQQSAGSLWVGELASDVSLLGADDKPFRLSEQKGEVEIWCLSSARHMGDCFACSNGSIGKTS